MKVLALTTRSPYPLIEGRALRTFNLLREIARDHEVHLCTFLQSHEEAQGLDELRKFCADVYAEPLYMDHQRLRLALDVGRDLLSAAPILANKYRRTGMARKVREWVTGRQIDVVHLDMLHLGSYREACAGRPTILVEHNVENIILERRAANEKNPLLRAYLNYQCSKARAYEARICGAVDEVVTVSDQDAQILRSMSPGGRFTTVPNGVDSDFFRNSGTAREPDSMVYVGGLSWYPNLDAMRFFCAEILPLIQQQRPKASLTIVGQVPNSELNREFAGFPNVRLAGLVDDVRPYISGASVFVVPLRIGGGTRLKILDALSMASPLVSTRIGHEGLDLQEGRHLLVADEPQAFADAVLRLFADPPHAMCLGAAGRQLVCEHYDWRSIAKILATTYAGAVERRAFGITARPA